MKWLSDIVDEIEKRHPSGELLVSSGVTPSGIYHIGHLREVLTADAIYLELRKRRRKVRHIHVVDDFDVLRKIPPVDVLSDYKQYLGKAICDIPAPDGSGRSYADYFFDPFLESMKTLGVEMEIMRSHKQYRSGFFVLAIERALEKSSQISEILQNISGHKLGEEWSPIQINEDGYLKKRKFISIDTISKTVKYLDANKHEQIASYDKGNVKLDWRIDWPARWWLLGVNAEPFGRDHATKGGSYDTGVEIARRIFETEPPLPVPYDFVNLAGDTKKMSSSRGTGISIEEVIKVLPPEVVRFFILRYPPSKRLYFDPKNGVSQLIDEFAAISSKIDKTDEDNRLLEISTQGLGAKTVSRVPFSHLVTSYQAALKDPNKTLEIIRRTEHAKVVDEDESIIKNELRYIDGWLKYWAPEEVKFELLKRVDTSRFSENQKQFLSTLSNLIKQAPKDADGEWFHKAVYDSKGNLEPKDAFAALYKVLIGKDIGPRAGWFLSILPREWLVKRLCLKG